MAPRVGILGPLPAEDLTELRRQQAAFRQTRVALDRQNGWMAVPALAPAAVVMGLEGVGIAAARAAGPRLATIPLRFPGREPARIGGDNHAARVGRRAHKYIEQTVKNKENWKYEEPVKRPGQPSSKPDIKTPRDRYIEVKPDTPSGHRAGARAVERYRSATRRPTRAVYYDPKDPRWR